MPSSIVADLAAVAVAQHDLVAGHAQARGAELLAPGAVAEIDGQHLGRAEPFDDLEPGELPSSR